MNPCPKPTRRNFLKAVVAFCVAPLAWSWGGKPFVVKPLNTTASELEPKDLQSWIVSRYLEKYAQYMDSRMIVGEGLKQHD